MVKFETNEGRTSKFNIQNSIFNPMQLRTKVILFIGTIVISLAVLAVFYLETSVKESFKKQIINNIRIIAEEKEGTYFAFIETLKTLTVNWSSDSYIKELVEKIVDERLSLETRKASANALSIYLREKKMKYSTDVVLVDILDQNGIIIASSDQKRIGVDEYKEEVELGAHHFSKTINASFGEVFSRSVIFEEDEHTEPMFHLTTRSFSSELNAQGEFIPLPAVFLVHFASLSKLSDFFVGKSKELQIGPLTSKGFTKSFETSEIYVVNKEGFVVTPTRTIKSALEKKRINTKPVEECFKNVREVAEEYLNYQGVQVFGASMCLVEDGLVLITEVETREAYVLYDELVRDTIIAGAAVFITIILITFLVGRRILNRFALIVDTAKKVAKGDVGYRTPKAGKDEIGYLAQVFNTMLDNVSVSQDKLKEADKKLQEEAVLLIRDIEEHKKQEKFLEESKRAQLNLLEDAWEVKEKLEVEKNRLNTILVSIGDGLVLIDGQYNISLVNPKAEEIFMIPREELLGKDLRTVMKLWKKRTKELNPSEWPTEEMFLTKAVVVADMEDDLSLTTDKRKDQLPVALSVAPLGGGLVAPLGGGLFGAVIVLRDVTDDRELDEAKSGFISVASHQLRTPLTTIRWYSEMLLSGDAGALTESQRDFLDEIHGGAERLYQTIDLLLGISRVESGKQKLEKVPINLTSFTEDIVKELRPQIDIKKIIFTTVPPDGDGVIVVLDSLMFRQVVLNLFSNSIRYTNDQGTIDASWVINENKSNVIYSVRDNGIGIPVSQRGRIFSKFFRAENALQKAPDGSGLGLALVKELVGSWGGKVWFETAEGKGTTFYFTIPLTSQISPIA